MARQVLENGVILPAEYSDDWYDDMTSNLTKLDDVIGSDSEKLSSSDVGAAALSNNYNDLDNLPTIPTVNDATLTIQKNGVDVQTFTANASSNVTCNITVPTKTSDLTNDSDFVVSSNLATVATSGDYDDLSNKPSIPTNTSDLTNDSNFVDTSNSAVASGITSAKVTDYDTHIADTDIHVTTSDKTSWNTVTSKANDSDVVHKSGNETIAGVKTFSDNPVIGNNNTNISISNRQITANGSYSAPTGSSYSFMQLKAVVNYADSSPSIDATVGLSIQENAYSDGKRAGFNPNSNNTINLGLAGKRWANVYATNYYYGGSEVEFSTKFVTTDTNQTVSGAKTFSSDLTVANTDTTANTPNLMLKNSKYSRGSTTELDTQYIRFLDKTNKNCGQLSCYGNSSGNTLISLFAYNTDSNNQTINSYITLAKSSSGDASFYPNNDNVINLGVTNKRWSDVQTYKVNALEPSSLSLPSDRSARIDISSYITNLGNGDNNQYIVPANGYIWLHFTSINSALCYSQTSGGLTNYAQTFVRYQGDGQLYAFFPVRKNDYFIVQIYTASTAVVQNAFFIPCLGNV